MNVMNIFKKYISKIFVFFLCIIAFSFGVFAAPDRSRNKALSSDITYINSERDMRRIDRMSLYEIKIIIPSLWRKYLYYSDRVARAVNNDYIISLNTMVVSQYPDLAGMLSRAGYHPDLRGLRECCEQGESGCNHIENPVFDALGEKIFEATFNYFFNTRSATLCSNTLEDKEIQNDLVKSFANSWKVGGYSYRHAHANAVRFGHDGIGEKTGPEEDNDDGYINFNPKKPNESFNNSDDGYYSENMGISKEVYLEKYKEFWKNLAKTLIIQTDSASRFCSIHINSHPCLGELYI